MAKWAYKDRCIRGQGRIRQGGLMEGETYKIRE